jgi:hypothetical protein
LEAALPGEDANVLEKSDCALVPVNRPNKGGQLPAEGGEGRALLEENIVLAHMLLTLIRIRMFQGLNGVREADRSLGLLSRHHLSKEPYA